MAKYDAIVIGAGVIGAATGYYLAKKGLKVVIVEKDYPASGASGACNGGLSYFGKKGRVLQAAYESLLMYRDLAKELNCPLQLCQDELFVQLALTEEEVVQLEKNVEECKKIGLEAELVSKNRLHKLLPQLSSKPIAAAIAQGGLHGFVNPFNVVYGYLAKVRAMGGTILTNWEVTKILTRRERIEGVGSKEQVLYAPIIVLCGGLESTYLLNRLQIKLDIVPTRGVVLVTEKVPWKLKKKIMGSSFGTNDVTGVSLCIEQSIEGNLLIGSSHEQGTVNHAISYKLIGDIASNALSFYPPLEKVSVIRTFSGIRPYREEGPFIGAIEGYKGLYVASGHSGMGITLAPWTGQSIASLIVN